MTADTTRVVFVFPWPSPGRNMIVLLALCPPLTLVRTISLHLGIYQFRTQEGHLFIAVVGPNCVNPSSALMARGRPGANARLRSSIQISLVLGKAERGFQKATIMASLEKEQADHVSNESTIKSLLGLSAGWWPEPLKHMRLYDYSN